MTIVDQRTTAHEVADCMVRLCERSVPELDTLYRQSWSHLSAVVDTDPEKAHQYWVTVLAIEELRQYQQGQVNQIRNR